MAFPELSTNPFYETSFLPVIDRNFPCDMVSALFFTRRG